MNECTHCESCDVFSGRLAVCNVWCVYGRTNQQPLQPGRLHGPASQSVAASHCFFGAAGGGGERAAEQLEHSRQQPAAVCAEGERKPGQQQWRVLEGT